MARDFFQTLPSSRRVFEAASDALGFDVASLCFNDDPRLDSTEFTQPALLTAEFAMYRGLVDELGFKADLFAGHSVGEYTALVAAEVLPLAVAVQLLRLRGRLMQRAAPAGSVLVVRGAGVLASVTTERAQEWGVDLACKNSPAQVVLSGAPSAIERAGEQVQALFPERAVELVRINVSAAFHSRLMRPVEPGLRAALFGIADGLDPERAHTVASNFTGDFHVQDGLAIIDALVSQVSATVRWTDNMARIQASGARVYEIGPGRTLSGLFASAGQQAVSLSTLASARRQLEHAA